MIGIFSVMKSKSQISYLAELVEPNTNLNKPKSFVVTNLTSSITSTASIICIFWMISTFMLSPQGFVKNCEKWSMGRHFCLDVKLNL